MQNDKFTISFFSTKKVRTNFPLLIFSHFSSLLRYKLSGRNLNIELLNCFDVVDVHVKVEESTSIASRKIFIEIKIFARIIENMHRCIEWL